MGRNEADEQHEEFEGGKRQWKKEIQLKRNRCNSKNETDRGDISAVQMHKHAHIRAQVPNEAYMMAMSVYAART